MMTMLKMELQCGKVIACEIGLTQARVCYSFRER